MSKKETSIFSRPLRDTAKLVGMKDTVLDSIKLESSGNHLLNELAKGIEQDNMSKGLRSVVGWFARLRNNDRDRLLEVSRPALQTLATTEHVDCQLQSDPSAYSV